jgi:hypothetical protein
MINRILSSNVRSDFRRVRHVRQTFLTEVLSILKNLVNPV